MLTILPAKALQLEKQAGLKVGILQPDYTADFVLYEATVTSDNQSVAMLYDVLFHESTSIKAVWVAGKSIYKI